MKPFLLLSIRADDSAADNEYESFRALAGLGSKDGRGCGDHDQMYTFGRRPRGIAPFPFTVRQYSRLLALRGCIADGLVCSDDLDAAGFAAEFGQPETDLAG